MLILYFDEDHRSVMIKFGFLEKYIFIFLQVILCFGFDHRAVVMLPDFHSIKRGDFDRKVKIFF